MFRPILNLTLNKIENKYAHTNFYQKWKIDIVYNLQRVSTCSGIAVKIWLFAIFFEHTKYYCGWGQVNPGSLETPGVVGDTDKRIRHATTPPYYLPHFQDYQQYVDHKYFEHHMDMYTDHVFDSYYHNLNDDQERESQTPIMEALLDQEAEKIEDEQRFRMTEVLRNKKFEDSPKQLRETAMREKYNFRLRSIEKDENILPEFK